MSWTVPMFPLNSVLFPGVTIPLRIFEQRYLNLAEHLLSIESPADRLFGSVAIREGYEVGAHGSRSVYRVGCLIQATELERQHDGTYYLLGVGRDRFELLDLDMNTHYPSGDVADRPEATGGVSSEVVETAKSTFTAFRSALSQIAADPYEGSLPQDPTMLSWTLSACAPLPMADRQELLEAEDAEDRLQLITAKLRAELEAMNVISSLPATEVARTGWSPN